MHLISSFIQGKTAVPDRCEDGYVCTDHFAAVVDGSTSKAAPAGSSASMPKTSKTGGRLAMETVCRTIETLSPSATLHDLVSQAKEALRALWPEGAEREAALRPTCSAVVYSVGRREVWMIGDCQCRFGGLTHTNNKAIDDILAQIRSDVLHYWLTEGCSVESLRQADRGRAFIYDALRTQTNFQNIPDAFNPFRYTVLDGQTVDETTIPVLPVGRADRLILASDGYPVLFDSLTETEAYLKDCLRADPLCIDRHPATKGLSAGHVSFDDRTYLLLDITP